MFGDDSTTDNLQQVTHGSVEVTRGRITNCRPGESLDETKRRCKHQQPNSKATTTVVDLTRSPTNGNNQTESR